MTELFQALTITDAQKVLRRHLPAPENYDEIPLMESLGRVLAEDIYALDDVPGFARSTMDGFATRAKDTFGASESMPAYLSVKGEVIMGAPPRGKLLTGQVWRIATGGMLPEGADAVVMVEYTEEMAADLVLINKAVAPGENIIRPGEDVAAGSLVFQANHRVRPQDLGMLAAVGVLRVKVRPRTRVGILSTGDELVAPSDVPAPGQVRDINSYSLAGAVAACGGTPRYYGIIRDEQEELEKALVNALADNDIVLMSGGSSVGTRDFAATALKSIGQPGVLFHGLSMKPGKPALGAVVDGKPVFGLPGHPASAMVVFDAIIAPLISRGGYLEQDQSITEEYPLQAEITRNMPSAAGREDFIRVRLFWRGEKLFAEPVLGKSGLISTMTAADGLAYIPAGKEGVEAGETVRVKFF